MRPQTAGRRAGGQTGLQQVQRPREPCPTKRDEEARDDDAPAVVLHQRRLSQPQHEALGDGNRPEETESDDEHAHADACTRRDTRVRPTLATGR